MIKDVEERLQSDIKKIRLKHKIRIYVCVVLNNSGSVGSRIRGENFIIELQLHCGQNIDGGQRGDGAVNFTSKLPRFTGLSTRSFFSRFSQSVDM